MPVEHHVLREPLETIGIDFYRLVIAPKVGKAAPVLNDQFGIVCIVFELLFRVLQVPFQFRQLFPFSRRGI